MSSFIRDLFTNRKKAMRAAYALNLCTVSVSQIIESKDIRVMEQEYEAILNNLNLQNFPKDEALLEIIKQILNSVTFFKLQEGEKKQIEKEYQTEVKNAIWGAIPGLGIIPSGEVFSAVASIVAQVGIGYMNYRGSKKKAETKKEKAYWQLERAALEQFEGLRRELFETAWRLSEKYNYDEKYRLTERLISQYNGALSDPDAYLRYQRLLYLKDQGVFEAYPPILYYLGHAANEIYKSCEDAQYYEAAQKYLSEYINCFKDGNELLREDVLLSQAYLEYFELLGSKKCDEKYLESAAEKSGNALDVKQMCAISFIKTENYEKAEEILLMLINEDYNGEINAQLLSMLYAKMLHRDNGTVIKKREALSQRAAGTVLVELPINGKSYEECYKNFIERMKASLFGEYANELIGYVNRYQIDFVRLWLDNGADYVRYTEFFMNMAEDMRFLTDLPVDLFIEKIEGFVKEINKHCEKRTGFEERDAIGEYTKHIKPILEIAARKVKSAVDDGVKRGGVFGLADFEDRVAEYKEKKGSAAKKHEEVPISDEQKRIERMFLGDRFKEITVMRETFDSYKAIIGKEKYSAKSFYTASKISILTVTGEAYLEIIKDGEEKFEKYIRRHSKELREIGLFGSECFNRVIAIFNSKRPFNNVDILLTTQGVVCLKNWKKIQEAEYSEVHFAKDENGKTVLEFKNEYRFDAIDFDAGLFVELCKEISELKENAENNDFNKIIKDILK